MFCSSLFIFFLDIYYNKYIIFRFPIPQLRLPRLLDIWEISSPAYYKSSPVYLALECTSISKRRYSSKNLVNLIKITWNCLLFSVELISEFLLQALILSENGLWLTVCNSNSSYYHCNVLHITRMPIVIDGVLTRFWLFFRMRYNIGGAGGMLLLFSFKFVLKESINFLFFS